MTIREDVNPRMRHAPLLRHPWWGTQERALPTDRRGFSGPPCDHFDHHHWPLPTSSIAKHWPFILRPTSLLAGSDVILFVNDLHFRIKFILIRGFHIVWINSWKIAYRMLFRRNRHTSLPCIFGRFFRTKKPFNLSRYEFFAIDRPFYFCLFSFFFYESFL